METNIDQLEIFYEIVMSIGRSLNLTSMLKQSLSVFLRKLNCSAGGVFLFRENKGSQPTLKTFVIPRTFAATKEYNEISHLIIGKTGQTAAALKGLNFPPRQISCNEGNTLIMQLPDIGFIFLKNNSQPFKKPLIRSLADPVSRLAGACIACYQNEELIQAQYDLELRVARRTKQLEDSNRELTAAYSNLKTAQKQLIQSEKMVSLGQLAAGVAHEINNPTGFITSNLHTMTEYWNAVEILYSQLLELLDKKGGQDTKAAERAADKIRRTVTEEDIPFILNDGKLLLSESIDGAERIKKIVLGLSNFARMDESQYKPADINKAVRDALRLTWNELKYKCQIEENYGELPEIVCRQEQLTQVFVNIIVNAAHAIQSDGMISIETSNEAGFIIIKIRDTGEGISEENLEKIFDPFFTTKEIGQGTGLGLSISHGIIEEHGGTIEAESTPGTGTCFIIKLPAKGALNE